MTKTAAATRTAMVARRGATTWRWRAAAMPATTVVMVAAAETAALLATDAGEEGRVCHLGAVCVNTLYASDVDLLLGKPRFSELERCAVQLHRLAGRHGRRPNCSGLHVARPKGPP